jgi:parallel beta-helix repeat protein
MGAMTRVVGRRSWLLAGLVCAGLGASAMWAVQSGASGSAAAARATAPSPAAPTPPPRPAGAPKPAAVAPLVAATNVHCGQVLIASVTLNGDLFCTTGVALIINKASVVLNLGGHRIDGGGTGGIGVSVQANSDTVTNGVITNFGDSGVSVYGATDTVSAIRAVGNDWGILDYGTGTKITNCIARGNTHGIVSYGSGGAYSGDHELNNSTYGLYLLGSKTVVTSNTANGNGNSGIYDGGSGNTLTKNTANFNGYDGIHATDQIVIDGGGNLAKGNNYTIGTPIQCYGVVCT